MLLNEIFKNNKIFENRVPPPWIFYRIFECFFVLFFLRLSKKRSDLWQIRLHGNS
jgi:hypothetical protein